jgi:hypothetical protein
MLMFGKFPVHLHLMQRTDQHAAAGVARHDDGSGTSSSCRHRRQPPLNSIFRYNILYIVNTGSEPPDNTAIEAPPPPPIS